MSDLDVPIAIRRPRRSSNLGTAAGHAEANLHSRQPKTPRRERKAVRFSDPGLAAQSSGLTPMIRRACIAATPSRRRASTPGSRCKATPQAVPCSPSAREPPVTRLHHTADGRVERRIRRSNLRDLLNRLEQQKRQSIRTAQAEICHLRAQLTARDRSIYELQNATVVIDSERLWDLERQIEELKAELERRASDTHSSPRDPFPDEMTDIAPDEDYFGDMTMANLVASTPSKARSSFPTPPATSPVLAATPCWRMSPAIPVAAERPVDMGVQTSFTESLSGREQLQEELASLQLEVCKLTSTLQSYQGLGERVSDRLSSVTMIPLDDQVPIPTDGVEALERQVEGLVRAMSDRTAALAHLTSAIADLGFPGGDAGEMLTALASGFRAARLELEYLTPGEVVLPLSSHGAEVLDLLLIRLRDLAKRAQEDEASIDEYHEIEQSLRKQLDARVAVIEGLKAEMAKAEGLMSAKNAKIQELQVGNDRLKGAIDGYARDISELEKLVERMEQEAHDARATHGEALEAKQASVVELERKLAGAMQRTASLQREISDIQDKSTRHVVTLNKQHGAALALRDARVSELLGETDRVNECLRAAHETIRKLRVDRSGLEARARGQREESRTAMDAVKEELRRVLDMSQQFLDLPSDGAENDAASTARPQTVEKNPAVASGGFMSAAPLRRGSKKRRYDSGMGLLEEDEVNV
ncbi:hypothetical protein HIM_01149 [Hirsutella minnesotensis 3608]|nr:hypothetical protein HIM_01149 [Hirsutella minnesotensis 3608]